MKPSAEDNKDRALLHLIAAAKVGARCPMNDQLPGGAASMTRLARAGLIRVEVFDKNFRRITILTGEHAGKSTMDPPAAKGGAAARPYLVSDARGCFRNGVPVMGPSRIMPKPTLLFGADGKRVRS